MVARVCSRVCTSRATQYRICVSVWSLKSPFRRPPCACATAILYVCVEGRRGIGEMMIFRRFEPKHCSMGVRPVNSEATERTGEKRTAPSKGALSSSPNQRTERIQHLIDQDLRNVTSFKLTSAKVRVWLYSIPSPRIAAWGDRR